MKEIIGKLISLELGMLSMTRDKVKGAVDELIHLGEVTQDEGRKLVDEYIARGEKSKQELRSEVRKIVLERIADEDLVRRAEFEQLRRELQGVKEELRRGSREPVAGETKGM